MGISTDVAAVSAGSVVCYMVYRSCVRKGMGIASRVSNTISVVKRAPKTLSTAVRRSTSTYCKYTGRAFGLLPRRGAVIRAHLLELCDRTDTTFARHLQSYLVRTKDISEDLREFYGNLYEGKNFTNQLIDIVHEADLLDASEILSSGELLRISDVYSNDDRKAEAVLRELSLRDNVERHVLVINADLSVSAVSEKPPVCNSFPKGTSKTLVRSFEERGIFFKNQRVTIKQLKLAGTLRKHIIPEEIKLMESVVESGDKSLGLLGRVRGIIGKSKSHFLSLTGFGYEAPQNEHPLVTIRDACSPGSHPIRVIGESSSSGVEPCRSTEVDKFGTVAETVPERASSSICNSSLAKEEVSTLEAIGGSCAMVPIVPVAVSLAAVAVICAGVYYYDITIIRNHASDLASELKSLGDYDLFSQFLFNLAVIEYPEGMPDTVKEAVLGRIGHKLNGHYILTSGYNWLLLCGFEEYDTSEAKNLYHIIDEYCDEFISNAIEFKAVDIDNLGEIISVKTCAVPLFYPTRFISKVRHLDHFRLALHYVDQHIDGFLCYLGLGYAPSAHFLANYHHGYRGYYKFAGGWLTVDKSSKSAHYIDVDPVLLANHRYTCTVETLFADSVMVGDGTSELPDILSKAPTVNWWVVVPPWIQSPFIEHWTDVTGEAYRMGTRRSLSLSQFEDMSEHFSTYLTRVAQKHYEVANINDNDNITGVFRDAIVKYLYMVEHHIFE